MFPLGNDDSYLVETATAVPIGHNLDRRRSSIGDVETGRYVELADAEVSKNFDDELWAQLDAEAGAWHASYGHVYSEVGLRMAQVELHRTTADWPVCSLLLNIVVATAGELIFSSFLTASGGRPVELEVREGGWEERERKECFGNHGGSLVADSRLCEGRVYIAGDKVRSKQKMAVTE